MAHETCFDRIDEALENRASDFETYMNSSDAYEEGCENAGIGPFYEYGLCFDVVTSSDDDHEELPVEYCRFVMSTGGPGDEIRFFPSGRIEYWFLDWFDGACRDVTSEDWAQWLWDTFDDLGMLPF